MKTEIPYKEGDVLYDLQHREAFVFREEYDGDRARFFPQHLRFATEEEKANVKSKKSEPVAPLKHQPWPSR